MQIQTTRRLEFKFEQQSFVTAGKNTIQDAPDWIVKDDYFHAAKRAGVLNVLSLSRVNNKVASPSPDGLSGEGEVSSFGLNEGTARGRQNTTTVRELLSLGWQQACAAIQETWNADVLKEAYNLEGKKQKPRGSVLKAITEQLHLLEATSSQQDPPEGTQNHTLPESELPDHTHGADASEGLTSHSTVPVPSEANEQEQQAENSESPSDDTSQDKIGDNQPVETF